MKRLANRSFAVLTIGLAIVAIGASSPEAGVRFEVSYTSGPADIRVWLADEYDDGYRSYDDYDVYSDVDDVVLYVRASRSCFATVYVVDTDGYIHVIHPLSPADEQFLRGGQVYAFPLAETEFRRYGFDRGVAYVYAVSSPMPFTFASYGWDVFGGSWGYRIYGDPYLAAHEFYASLLPAGCSVSRIGVAHARFYVREYVRYPRYLCVGWHDYHGVRQYCRGSCAAYRYYHVHAKDPYVVLRPDFKIKHVSYETYTGIRRSTDVKYKKKKKYEKANSVVRRTASRPSWSKTTSRRVVELNRRAPQSSRVVKSSKSSVIKGKADLDRMRDRLEKRSTKPRSVVKATSKKTTVKRSKAVKSRVVKKNSNAAPKSDAAASKKSKKKAKRDAR